MRGRRFEYIPTIAVAVGIERHTGFGEDTLWPIHLHHLQRSWSARCERGQSATRLRCRLALVARYQRQLIDEQWTIKWIVQALDSSACRRSLWRLLSTRILGSVKALYGQCICPTCSVTDQHDANMGNQHFTYGAGSYSSRGSGGGWLTNSGQASGSYRHSFERSAIAVQSCDLAHDIFCD